MKRTVLLLSAASLGAGCALAADVDTAADSTKVYNLKEVSVVATRATEQTPIAFTNVTAADLERNNDGLDLPYLLQATPSVITTSDAGAGVGYTSIRVRGTDGSRINVTANGIPVNDAESHNVYWVNMPDFASSLKDVQIQRGAGTSTNGAGAFGASINMMTATPSPSPYGELNASYGMYNTNKQTLRAGTGLMGGHWTVDARLSHIGTDGWIERAWAKMWSYMGQVGFYNGGTSLRLLAFGGKQQTYMAWDYATREEMDLYGRRYNPCGEYTDDEGNRAYYPDQVDNYTQHNFQLILNQQLSRDFSLTAALHYTKGDGYYEQYKPNRTLVEYGLEPFVVDGVKVKKVDLIRLKNMENGFGGGIFSLNYRHGRVNATLGGGLNNYRGHHFGQIAWVKNYVGALSPLQEYYRNKGEKLDGNIYARANVDIAAGLSAYADLQYRHISYTITGISDTYDWNTEAMQTLDIDRRFDFFNPKAGITWQPNSRHRAYASFAVAHREPTRDNFIDTPPEHTPLAERLYDWEAGYNLSGSMLSVGANIYYMDYKNQLVPTGRLSDTGNTVSENVARSYRLGIELTGSMRPLQWLEWQLTTTWSRNRIRDFVEYVYEDGWTNPVAIPRGDTPLAFSPSFTLHNAFNITVGGFMASLQSQFVGKQYLLNSGNEECTLPHYFVTDLHLNYTFKKILGLRELTLGATIYNLFSEKYFNNGYAYGKYSIDDKGERVFTYTSGYAAQAPVHVMGSIAVKF